MCVSVCVYVVSEFWFDDNENRFDDQLSSQLKCERDRDKHNIYCKVSSLLVTLLSLSLSLFLFHRVVHPAREGGFLINAPWPLLLVVNLLKRNTFFNIDQTHNIRTFSGRSTTSAPPPPPDNNMACLNTLKLEIKTLERIFPKTHERFRILNASVDELTCRFIGKNGKTYDIHANITVSAFFGFSFPPRFVFRNILTLKLGCAN